MNAVRFALCVFGLLAGCTGPLDATSQEHAIIDGEPAPDDAAVGYLQMWSRPERLLQSCTATLLTPRLALTAAHCLVSTTQIKYVTLTPVLEPSAARDQRVYATSWKAHELYDRATISHDVGLVRFSEDVGVATAPTAPLGTLPPENAAGTPARVVGYGVNRYDGNIAFIKRRQTTTTIEGIEGAEIITAPGPQVCHGDSGGPLFVATATGEVIAGIASWASADGEGESCLGFHGSTRVESYLDWIAANAEPPVAPAAEGGCHVGASASVTTPISYVANLCLAFALLWLVRRRCRDISSH